jgi:hypothetical protein
MKKKIILLFITIFYLFIIIYIPINYKDSYIRKTINYSFNKTISYDFPQIKSIETLYFFEKYLLIESKDSKYCFNVEQNNLNDSFLNDLNSKTLLASVDCNTIKGTFKKLKKIKSKYAKVALFPRSGIFLDLSKIEDIKSSALVSNDEKMENLVSELNRPVNIYYDKNKKYVIIFDNIVPEYNSAFSLGGNDKIVYFGEEISNDKYEITNLQEIEINKMSANYFAIYHCYKNNCLFNFFKKDANSALPLPYLIDLYCVQNIKEPNRMQILTLPYAIFLDSMGFLGSLYGLAWWVWYFDIQGKK